ncbi:MAG: S-layer protein, partial [Candidatus Micrarchaeota archaeon]
MKSLNVKRIAALAAGTALLGASLAAASVEFQNVPIINNDGKPVVKVAVGEKADVSDAIAAANIAAVIGNLAYKSQTVTAQVSGTATCAVSGGSAGTGSCAVSNEKVALEVTLPGTVSGAYGFKTYVNDWIDKKVENRKNNTADDLYNLTADLSPFPNTVARQYAAKKVSGSDFASLATVSVKDPYSSTTYTEEQSIWLQGKTKYDTILKTVVLSEPNIAYRIEFTHDSYGVPFCTSKDTSSDGAAGDWSDCASDSDRTDRHRVPIKFLGENWIVSYLAVPSTNLSSATGELTGGSMKLAKESAYGVIRIGENLTAGAYTVKLADITVPTG